MTASEPVALSIAASRLQLPPGPWNCLLDGLCARFPRVSRSQWLQRFALGRVQDPQGRALQPGDPWKVGREIRYFREVADEQRIPFTERIIHHDEELLVVDKPHFLPVMPAGAYVHQTLLARLVAATGNTDLVPLHRLDRLTAGLVLFSTRPANRNAYQRLFRERRIEKIYEAWAPALPVLSFPITRRSRLEPGTPFHRMKESQGEANSESWIEVIDRREACWHYRLRPLTGRKHQLRLHMSGLGAPILGDDLYPDLRDRPPGDFTQPLQLLARTLSFSDPFSGAERHFHSGMRLAGPEKV